MFTVYVFCLVIGLGFTLLSMFSDFMDMGGDVDLDFDADSAVTGGGTEIGSASAWSKLFNIYGLLYFVFGFGLTGTALSATLGEANPATLPFAVGTGALSGFVVAKLVRYLKSSGSGVVEGDTSWEGATGTVLLPMGGESPGEVKVLKGERAHVLRALPHGRTAEKARGSALVPTVDGWSQVMVVEVRDGIAYVVPTDEDGTPLG